MLLCGTSFTDFVIFYVVKTDADFDVLRIRSSFSVDGKYVLAGQDENELTVYDSKSGDLVATHSGHTKPIGAIRCNPKYDMVATSCVHMALWLQTDVTANRRNSP